MSDRYSSNNSSNNNSSSYSSNHNFSSNDRPNYEIHDDKYGTTHINIYDGDPRDDHSSIHINYDSNTGSGTIVDTSSGSKDSTDIQCFLTTACMRHKMDKFDDNCDELKTLRAFRDAYVAKDDIDHYYEIAPSIVEEINKLQNSDEIFNGIYNNVVIKCVDDIKAGNYDEAYDRYRNSVLSLEEQYIKPRLLDRLVNAIKVKQI